MFVRILTSVAILLALTGCNLSDDQRVSNANNGGASDAGNNTVGDGSAGDSGETGCTPAACGVDQCGMIDDGCGTTIDCGGCSCTDANFETFCPEMPCLTVSGCSATLECEYEAVTCAGQTCACEDPENCSDDELRWCRDAAALTCPADACDPQPSVNGDGTMAYANVCGQPDGASCDYSDICIQGACAGTDCIPADCGVCGLGHWDCDETGGRACLDIPDSATSNAAANCNDRSPDSTFVYVDDVGGTDAAGSGSKAQPFASLSAAIQAAQTRGASGLIVRSGYVHSGTLELVDGVSIYSGYSGTPDWDYDDGFMSVDGGLTGVLAQQITERTVLHRLRIRSASAPSQSGDSSYGVRAIEAGELVLSQTQIEAGNGGGGGTGDKGTDGRSAGQTPSAPSPPTGGAPGTNPVCGIQSNGGFGGTGGSPGQRGQPGGASLSGIPGGPGGDPSRDGFPGNTAGNSPPGDNGPGGVAGYTIANGLWVPNGKGGQGTTGENGRGGGGGGGGGGTDDLFRPVNGGGGGGGGAGGCGGGGGGGGGPAGSSFGILAINSSGLQILDSIITAGNGGIGGAPGIGGQGGAPGPGALGGPGALRAGFGGRGGTGRQGGRGGVGGGGAGGDSIAIQCEATTLDPADLVLNVSNPGPGGAAPSPGADGVAQPERGCVP